MSPRRAVVALLLAAPLLVSGCTAGRPEPSAAPALASATRTPSSTPAVERPVTRGSDYLALGDSVSFGYREPDTRPAPDYSDAATFIGFPELIARRLRLHVANASCPGETSASLRDSQAPSNGCERGATGGAARGYRTHYPLHVRYSGSQLAFGVRYLRAHSDTRLVTLMIGANDVFRCGTVTADRCTSEAPAVLARVTSNVRAILRALREQAHYGGRIVIVSYYSSTYGGLTALLASALDSAVRSGARDSRVVVADGFRAFERVARRSGDSSCRAGLLTRLTGGGCGVHPSAAGQRLLADAVERVVRR